MLSQKNNRLYLENVSLEKLAGEYGTPLFVYSKNTILGNFNSFLKPFAPGKELICYALKANSNYSILKTLSGAGAGVDITSGGELYRAMRAGFKPSKTVYAGIGKTYEEIEYALKNNILMFNVESLEEIEAVNKAAGRLGRKAPVAFRVNPHIDPHTHHYITTGTAGVKFGIPFAEALDAYKTASKLKNIEIVGIHSHIGSQITSTKPFKMAAQRISGIVKKLAGAGIHLKYVDLGGGLGITYSNEKPPTPYELKKSVVPIFKGLDVSFIFEPGRSIIGNAGVLLAGVIYRKKAGGKNFLVVDTGMNDLLRPTLYEAFHDIVPAAGASRPRVKLDVVGPICETGDFLGKNRMIPWLNQGECLAVKCAGAYGYAMSSQYNSRARAAEVMVDGNKYSLIRRRETYKDLVALEK
ncbi:MAG TPA: diaminopimelate decarboxylase [Elusimicrobia bacterium]|nr:MAG: diaminopimelate decarboxylase [Elusimicrobia bacterium RIFOXYA12_FULL_49_49]OGS09221.1 MAG: diaminopimelate decarboxylase [Elusimicrobia bacterium RIFOXYA1_FULL_47_7]OGS10027.1 MAG: diaminopimelate decarboxylase [Elusimicrobia bacterium RIFOXYB1_FULL_48_9]OGS16208.1 MAG: diaminopimelate decarboxylase [Elusimicrobia bacterium RIFOXYA2_FULL_47_53]OGS26592.1 MAG: diaminopimelate decarboxylase [Elusimicrobia bacterium RIFOXYB12_FULL_50_12]OGS31363.1 MAG: diaminopimelate decarboxylase [Elus